MENSLYSAEECARMAEMASLRYVNPKLPGIKRRPCGKGFAYYSPQGILIKNKKELMRINKLAIPPAYRQVWICPWANGHIQAVGVDAKNRKQYRYHPLWRAIREQNKFNSLLNFGRALTDIREHLQSELSKAVNLSKTQVICAIIYLLDNCYIRIGNSIYAKQNQSYGLTTLRKKHLTIENNQAVLDFIGKNAKPWHVVLNDKKIIRILKKCEEIPGYELFKYLDENQQPAVITSQDINYYLQKLTNYPLTAKDFRTWAACREALQRFISLESPVFSLADVVTEVASLLGHTPAICRKNYIHSEIIKWWQEKKYENWVKRRKRYLENLTADELLLYWLEKNLPLLNEGK